MMKISSDEKALIILTLEKRVYELEEKYKDIDSSSIKNKKQFLAQVSKELEELENILKKF